MNNVIGLTDAMDNFLSKHDIFNNKPTSNKASLGHGPVKELFPEFLSIATTSDINLESTKSVHGWNITFRRLLHDWELERDVEFFKTLKSFQRFKDTERLSIWKLTSKGTYSVNSAYNILIRYSQSTNQWPWKSIWKMQLLSRWNAFLV